MKGMSDIFVELDTLSIPGTEQNVQVQEIEVDHDDQLSSLANV